jgi:large subunit ribosomal protein L30
MKSVRITQTRSVIGQTAKHRGTLRSLGLGKIGRSADHTVSPALQGKLRHVAHLVTVTPLDGKDA